MSKKKLNKDILRIIEKYEFDVSEMDKQGNEYCIELNQFTPAGEDWWETIIFDGTNDNFIYKVMERAYYFDVDDEVEIWIPNRGKGGCPSSILTLVEDAQWKKGILDKLSADLREWQYQRQNQIYKKLENQGK